MPVVSSDSPRFFLFEEIGWRVEQPADTPKELVEEAKRLGARRKFLAQGDGGFYSQLSEFPAGYTVPMHSHDHNEMIVILHGGCTMLGDGPTLKAGDSMVLIAGFEYGFAADADGMTFLTIRTERLERVAIPVTQIQVAISPGVKLNLLNIPFGIPPCRNDPNLRLGHQRV